MQLIMLQCKIDSKVAINIHGIKLMKYYFFTKKEKCLKKNLITIGLSHNGFHWQTCLYVTNLYICKANGIRT